MIDILLQIARETWDILKEASIFLLFGFGLAGVLAVLVPARILTRLVGAGAVKSVLWASALGAPVPLCSCGALPTALGLRRQGATPGATVAFLVATPETGLDSLSLSYALTDPILTIARPVAGVLTAVAAGLATNLIGVPWARRRDTARASAPDVGPAAVSPSPSAPAPAHEHEHEHGHCHDHLHIAGEVASVGGTAASARHTIGRIYRYAFELLDDTSYWLMLGIVLSGVVATALPPSLIERYLSGGLTSMLVMLLISIPVYTCASSSTPLAAALVMKGLNPGAALVFLLAGPATNLGSLVVLLKFMGARVVAVYLATIVAATLLAGWVLDTIYRTWEFDPRATFGAAGNFVPEPVKVAAALMLLALLVVSMRRTGVPEEWIWLRDRISSRTGVALDVPRLRGAMLAAAATLYLGSGLIQVAPGEVAVKERFGRIVARGLGPGLHYRLPWPIESDRIIRLGEVRRMEFRFPNGQLSREEVTRALVGDRGLSGSNSVPGSIKTTGLWFQKAAAEDSFLLTGDANLIDLRSALQYRVKDAIAYAYGAADPDALVRSTTLAALRGVVATRSIDAIYTTARDEVERQVARTVQADLDKYGVGVEVVSARLLYVHPPDAVHDAFRDVASAQEDKLRTINRANIFAVEKVNQSKGEAAAMVEQALALKEQDVEHAQGDVAAFALKLDAYRQAPELARFRLQLETIGAVLPGVQKIIRPGVGDAKDFDLWLMQPFTTGSGK